MIRIDEKSLRNTFHRVRVGLLRGYVSAIAASRRFRAHRPVLVETLAWAAIVIMGTLAVEPLQGSLSPYVDGKVFAGLQTVILTVGGAMIGATAIVFSFVLFAMQVNVERLPHGLFRRFSSDVRLLAAFGASFLLSIAATALSLVQDRSFTGVVALTGLGMVMAVLRLLYGAFRRSVLLVNPIEQLKLVRRSAEKQMRVLERRLTWTVPLIQTDAAQKEKLPEKTKEPQIDVARLAILHANRGWDRSLREASGHAVYYARRSGEQGDVQVSEAALSTLVALNRLYVRVKGRTFHANLPLFDDALATDAFINHSLEELRRLQDVVLARKDEQQAEQVLRTYLALVEVYTEIKYPGLNPSKSHALLAAGYLEKAVQATVPAGLVDTAMAGLRALGDAGRNFLRHGDAAEMTSMVKTIGLIGSAGALREGLRPLTLTAMEQLSDLTVYLLRTKTTETRFVAAQVRDSVQQIARVFLNVPDMPLSSTHSFYLGPYFSSTSLTSLRQKLTVLTNAVIEAEATNENAQIIADNLQQWADELYRGTKELLLVAIEKRSQFTFDLLHWIVGLSELFVAVARAPATREYTSRELEKHAAWLLATLTWIPRDRDTAQWIEHFSFIETIFDFAVVSGRQAFEQGYDDAWKLVLRWGLEAGREHTGWGTLQRALTALIALAVWRGENRPDLLKQQLERALTEAGAPSQEIRDHAARDLREKAETVREREFEFHSVERLLARNDRASTQQLLRDVANILSPGTANEPVRPFF